MRFRFAFRLSSALVGSAVLWVAGVAQAAFVTYTDRAAWELAVGPVVEIDFDAIAADHNVGSAGPFDAGPFTVSASGTFAGDNGIEAYDPAPTDIQSLSQDRNVDGTTHYTGDTGSGTVITLTFDAPTTAFGFDYVSMNGGFIDDSFNVNGSSLVFPAPSGFFGFVGSAADVFTELTIEGADGAFGADNFVMAPEPASFSLGVLGLAALAASARTRKRPAQPADRTA